MVTAPAAGQSIARRQQQQVCSFHNTGISEISGKKGSGAGKIFFKLQAASSKLQRNPKHQILKAVAARSSKLTAVPATAAVDEGVALALGVGASLVFGVWSL